MSGTNRDVIDTIDIITSKPGTRGAASVTKLKLEELSNSLDTFLDQMNKLLANVPNELGDFDFSELEVHADVSSKGSISLLGTGGEVGVAGGLKFVFRRKTQG